MLIIKELFLPAIVGPFDNDCRECSVLEENWKGFLANVFEKLYFVSILYVWELKNFKYVFIFMIGTDV